MDRAEDYSRAREFRRHVTMTTIIDGEEETLNIDIVHAYFETTKEIYEYAKKLIEEKQKI